MSDRICVMHHGKFEQIGSPNTIYEYPQTSYVASFVGDANLLKCDGKTYAIRGEKVLIGEEGCNHKAKILEKSYAGGQLRILFALEDGQKMTAYRYGVDYNLSEGENTMIGWTPESMVEVMDHEIA